MPIRTREVTARMAEANRQNARKSTGPRTPAGKQHVAYNALQHGLFGKPGMQFMLAADEDPKELQQILARSHRVLSSLHSRPADASGGPGHAALGEAPQPARPGGLHQF